MLGANGLLNIRFLNESTAQGWENFYIAIQNIYSLPEISNLTEKNEIIEIICSFVLFRIADAVMLGGLVAIITENDLGWTEERPKKTKQLEKK